MFIDLRFQSVMRVVLLTSGRDDRSQKKVSACKEKNLVPPGQLDYRFGELVSGAFQQNLKAFRPRRKDAALEIH